MGPEDRDDEVAEHRRDEMDDWEAEDRAEREREYAERGW